MSDRKRTRGSRSIRTLLKVLSKHYDVLVSAGSDQPLLKDYSTLVRFLKSAKRDEIERIFSDTTTILPKPVQSCDACDASTYLERYARDVYNGTKRHKRHTFTNTAEIRRYRTSAGV